MRLVADDTRQEDIGFVLRIASYWWLLYKVGAEVESLAAAAGAQAVLSNRCGCAAAGGGSPTFWALAEWASAGFSGWTWTSSLPTCWLMPVTCSWDGLPGFVFPLFFAGVIVFFFSVEAGVIAGDERQRYKRPNKTCPQLSLTPCHVRAYLGLVWIL